MDILKFQNDIRSIKNATFEKKISEMAHKSILGASIGAGLFIVYAWSIGKNSVVYGSIGAVIGGVFGYSYNRIKNNYISEKENSNEFQNETDNFYD